MSIFLKVSFFSGCLTLFKMLLGFAIAKVVAIYTGPSGMALLGQLQSFVVGVNGIVNAPVSNGVIKYTAENNSKGFTHSSNWWKPAIALAICFSVILASIGVPFSDEIALYLLNNSDYGFIIICTLCNLPLVAIGTFILSVINGQGSYKSFIILGFVSTFISSLLMLVMLYYFGIMGALLSTSLQYGLVGGILIVINFNQPWFKYEYFIGAFKRKYTKDILSYVFMAITSAISLPLTLIVIRTILMKETDIDIVGQWQAVWRISEAYIGIVTIALSTYFLPRLSSLSSAGEIKREIKSVLKTIIPLVIFIAVLIFLSKDLIIKVLFTESFMKAREYFLIQLIGDVIKIVSWVYAFPMLSTKATKWYIGTEVAYCLLWILLSLILVPIYNAQGVNIAYALSYLIYFLIIFLNFNKIIKVK